MSVRCSLCSERVGRGELEAHWKADLSYTPFSCRLCGFAFFSAADALQHFRHPQDTLHPNETRPQIVEKRVGELEERLARLRAEVDKAAEAPAPGTVDETCTDLASLIHDATLNSRPDEENSQEPPLSQSPEAQSTAQPQEAEEHAYVAPANDVAVTQREDENRYQVDLDCSLLDATLESLPARPSPAHSELVHNEGSDEKSHALAASATKPAMEPACEEVSPRVKPSEEMDVQTKLLHSDEEVTSVEKCSGAKARKLLSKKRNKCNLCLKKVKDAIQHALNMHYGRRPMFRCGLCPAVSMHWDRWAIELHCRKAHMEGTSRSEGPQSPSLFIDLRGDPETAATASEAVGKCFGPSFAFHGLRIQDAANSRQVRWIVAGEERAAEWEASGRARAEAAAEAATRAEGPRTEGHKPLRHLKHQPICRLCQRPFISTTVPVQASHVMSLHMEQKAAAACNFCSKQWELAGSMRRRAGIHLRSQHRSELPDKAGASILAGKRLVRSLLSAEDEALVIVLVRRAFGRSILVDGLNFRVHHAAEKAAQSPAIDEASAEELGEEPATAEPVLRTPQYFAQHAPREQERPSSASHALSLLDSLRQDLEKLVRGSASQGPPPEEAPAIGPATSPVTSSDRATSDRRGGPPRVAGRQRQVSALLRRCFGIHLGAKTKGEQEKNARQEPPEEAMRTKDVVRLEAFRRLAKAREERWEAAQSTPCPYRTVPSAKNPPKPKPQKKKPSECLKAKSNGFAIASLRIQPTKKEAPKRLPKRVDCVECGENVGNTFVREHVVFKHLKKPVFRCRRCPYEIFRWNDSSLARDHLRRKHGNPLHPGFMMEFLSLKDEKLTAEVMATLGKCFPGYDIKCRSDVNHRLSEFDGSQLALMKSYDGHRIAPLRRYDRAKTKSCRLCSLLVTETEEKNHVMLEHLDGGRAFKCKHCDHTSPYWSGDFKQLQTHMDTRHPGTGHWKAEVVDVRPELLAPLNALLPQCFGDDAKLVVLSKLLGFNH